MTDDNQSNEKTKQSKLDNLAVVVGDQHSESKKTLKR